MKAPPAQSEYNSHRGEQGNIKNYSSEFFKNKSVCIKYQSISKFFKIGQLLLEWHVQKTEESKHWRCTEWLCRYQGEICVLRSDNTLLILTTSYFYELGSWINDICKDLKLQRGKYYQFSSTPTTPPPTSTFNSSIFRSLTLLVFGSGEVCTTLYSFSSY